MKRITVKGATIVRVDGPVHLITAGGQVSVKNHMMPVGPQAYRMKKGGAFSYERGLFQVRYCISDSSTAETYCLCTPLGVAHENTYTGSTYFWGSVLISIQ